MPGITGMNFPDHNATISDLIDHVTMLQKTIEFYLDGNLDSSNTREIAGWLVSKDSLVSKNKLVGFSSLDTPIDDLRIWAGSTNPNSSGFRVYETGKTYVSDITIYGGNILWGTGGVNAPPTVIPSYADLFGPKPPIDANNTYSELLYNSNIRGFVNQNGLLFLSADYIRAGTITADIVRGGTISGVRIDVNTDLTVGNNINLGPTSSSTKSLIFNSGARISADGSASMTISAFNTSITDGYVNIGSPGGVYNTKAYGPWDFSAATVTGLGSGITAVFG